MILDFLFRASTSGGQKILTSQQLAEYLGGRSQSAAGVDVTPERAMRYAAVYSCVKVLAESVGQLPLHLYRRKDRDKIKATDHPLYSLLYLAPNDYQTAQEWKEWLVASLSLRGNAYCQIIRAASRIVALLPFPPGAVIPKRDPATRTVTYEVSLADGSREELPASEVLHVKLFPLDGLVGASPIHYARESIGLGIATEEHGAGLFARGAAPGGVLQSPKPLSKDVAERLKSSWEERFAGSQNSNRVAVLEDGLTWQSIGMNSSDAQFIESRKYQRSEIAGIYRVPPHLIGDLERSTFSNIEHQGLDFVVHSLMPYLTRIESRIAIQLLTPKEQKEFFAKFNVSSLLRGDMAARAEFYTKMVQNGALSPNEIREFEDQNSREGGDIYLVPTNLGVSLPNGTIKTATAESSSEPTQ